MTLALALVVAALVAVGLAAAIAWKLFTVAVRLRAALRSLRADVDALTTKTTTTKGLVDQVRHGVQDAKDRTGLLRSQTDTRLLGHSNVLRELRDGVQESKDRIGQVRNHVDSQLLDQSQVLGEVRHGMQDAAVRAAQQARLVHETRSEIHAMRSLFDGANRLSEGDLQALRTEPRVLAAINRLQEVRERVSPVALDDSPEPVDLSRLVASDLPAVTVVVTCYNDAEFVADALASVLNQSFTDFECVVVDDCSTDTSTEVVSAAIGDDPRFRLVRHDANRGPSGARNTGIDAARAPFLCFLDGDDLFYEKNLELRMEAFRQVTDRSVAGVFSGISQTPHTVSLAELPSESIWLSAPGAHDFLSMRGENPFPLHAPLLRTDIVRASGGFDESMRGGAEDWEFWQRILRSGFRFVPCRYTLAIYRQKPTDAPWRAVPSEFRRASTRILEQVNAPADPAARIPNCPYFYAESLSYYESQIALANRNFIFLGLAALSDDDSELSEALKAIPPALFPVLRQHSLAKNRVHAGLRRGLGLTIEEAQAANTEIAEVRDRLVQQTFSQPEARPVVWAPSLPLLSKHSRRPIDLFYWRTAPGQTGHGNFGDELSPLLVTLVAGHDARWAELESCELVAVGSVLDLVVAADHQQPAVWGAGFIRPGDTTAAGLHISSTRGRISSARCGSTGAIGDPALLARHLDVSRSGSHRVGLIPHYVDLELPIATTFEAQVRGSVLINPLSPPMDVVNAIAGCDFVFSSSLHGLIVADSLGVPNAWIELSKNVVGDGYKFADYYSCFDIEQPARICPVSPDELEGLIASETERYERPGLEQLIAGVADCFPTHVGGRL